MKIAVSFQNALRMIEFTISVVQFSPWQKLHSGCSLSFIPRRHPRDRGEPAFVDVGDEVVDREDVPLPDLGVHPDALGSPENADHTYPRWSFHAA